MSIKKKLQKTPQFPILCLSFLGWQGGELYVCIMSNVYKIILSASNRQFSLLSPYHRRKIYPFHPLSLSRLDFAPCELLEGVRRVPSESQISQLQNEGSHI